jgi:hypothetical protein
MKRLHQLLLIGSFLPLCWLLMQAVHELGHVAFALATGKMIGKVVLHPLSISRTDLADYSRPLQFVWAGPLIGVLLPLALWVISKATKLKWAYLPQFFAGFCLISNGVYIGIGSLMRVGAVQGIGDAGDMLREGSPIWLLWLFGIITVPLGFYLWNKLGPYFGLGHAHGNVDPRTAYYSCALSIIVVIFEVIFSAR